MLPKVFPAHAGVILARLVLRFREKSFSRTRGCDPKEVASEQLTLMFFPHTRGWSRWYRIDALSVWVFPAHAGVIPVQQHLNAKWPCFSRTRGGDPRAPRAWIFETWFFPHTRGWSLATQGENIGSRVFPAHAGGDPRFEKARIRNSKFFPHTRGWSYRGRLEVTTESVFPAHAGVILDNNGYPWFCDSFSRTRGGDPGIFSKTIQIGRFFPHTRVWSFTLEGASGSLAVFLAHAGVILANFTQTKLLKRFSRIRRRLTT